MRGVIFSESDCAVKLEELARLEAFYEFEKQIMFSLMVWQTDDLIKSKCQPVTEWLKDCVSILQKMINKTA